MKQYLATVLALVCIVLVLALVVTKRRDTVRQETDAGTIAGISNRLDTAQARLTDVNRTVVTFSNSLDVARSASVTFSNRLIETKSALALDAEQITALTRQVAMVESENQTLSRRLAEVTAEMTGQIAGLTNQLALSQASLDEVSKNSALLEDRLRRDVAERVLVERKFNSPVALKAQLEKCDPWKQITAEGIYAGLDVVVTSNRFHVVSPN